MIITIEQLKQIMLAGGGMVIDASTLTFNQLLEIATAAATSNTRFTLHKVSGYTTAQLIKLATLAPGLITFDLTS